MSEWEPLWRILAAAGMSIPVGLERELRGKAAGLRTHVVVAVASAALGYVSVAAAAGAAGNDATRIAGQVVTGIGFMGAGVIFASGGRVHGLTTAAALWSAMAIGLCAGLGAYGAAGALVVVTVVFLAPVDVVSERLTRRFGRAERTFHIVTEDVRTVTRAQESLARFGASSRQIELSSLGDRIAARLIVQCRDADVAKIFDDLSNVEGVSYVSDEAVDHDRS